MHTIKLIGTIGEDKFYYSAVMPHRSGWTEWNLYFGDFYQGSLLFEMGGWRAYLNGPTKNNSGGSQLSSEDIQVFIDEIERMKQTI